jgi:ribosomal protein S2
MFYRKKQRKEVSFFCWHKSFVFFYRKKQAKRCDSFYINYRWLGGMLTNWNTVQNRIERLKFLETKLEGNFETLSQKIIVLKERN